MDIIKYDSEGKAHTVNDSTTTKYDGQVFNRYLEHCYHGGSTPEFCRQERISRTTFDKWIEKYDPKGLIKPLGKTLAEGWWMSQGREHLVTKTETSKDGDSSYSSTTRFDTNLYKYVMGGRFGHTADKAMMDLAKKIVDRLDAQAPLTQGAIATEPEYELVEEEEGTKNEA